MRLLIAVLIVINLALFARLMEWLPGVLGDQPDTAPFARQVNPEQLKILPAPPGALPGAQPGTPSGSTGTPRP
jgi:hypothetical protein